MSEALTSGADFYARKDEPQDREQFQAALKELTDSVEAAGATWVRITLLNDTAPCPRGVLPHGLYIEGWKVRPDPQPEFGYPAELV
ncbi:hypothetical protein [Sphingomonas melonis]|uniref:hypothetical protein n=1 Tax=Sphingomonas melonis TaxID=152682 RepID=UPI0035C8141E